MASSSSGPKKFLLLAWNIFEKEEILQDKKIIERINKFLSIYNFFISEENEPEEINDMVVVVPRDSDAPFSIDELRFFHRGLGGKCKKVLYIHITAQIAFAEGRISDWLFFINRPGFDPEELSEWMNSELNDSTSSIPSSIPFEEWTNLYISQIEKAKTSDPSSFDDWIKEKKNYGFFYAICKSASKMLSKTKSVAQLFFSLHRISGRFAKLEHDFMSDSSEESASKKQILLASIGLRDSMILSCQPIEIKNNYILLIDDKPDLFFKPLEEILNLSTGLSLHTWNPSTKNSGDEVSLSELEGYSSIKGTASDGIGDLLMKKISIEGRPKDGSLKKALTKARIILVDILLKGHSGHEAERGFNVIRGLHRLYRDFSPNHEMPAIIAISRSDDLNTIQRALGAGASGFTLKSNLLGVSTAILAGWRQSSEFAGTARRNFRLMYTLPHKTIGLLRSILLPTDLYFHQYQNNDKKKIREALPFARLIAAIPKAELHVHAGSCMQPEFLVAASLVMLGRHKSSERSTVLKGLKRLIDWTQNAAELNQDLCKPGTDRLIPFGDDEKIFSRVAGRIRDVLKRKLESYKGLIEDPDAKASYQRVRSVLHNALNIPDFIDIGEVCKRLDKLQDIHLLVFAIKHGDDKRPCSCTTSDIIRLLLIWLASQYDNCSVQYKYKPSQNKSWLTYDIDIKAWFHHNYEVEVESDLKSLHDHFFKKSIRPFSFKQSWPIWSINLLPRSDRLKGTLDDSFLLENAPDYEDDRISYLLATGTRCENLKTYLDGCELSGSEHLQHPYLINLYAQQTVWNFVRHGVMYVELRAAISGYESFNDSIQFTFNDACSSMLKAFSDANESTIYCHQGNYQKKNWLWNGIFELEDLFNPLHSRLAEFRFPVRVNLILTGKRHKPSREMMREAAAGIIFHSQSKTEHLSANLFKGRTMSECRIIGFDLAGQEDGYPPDQFRHEFERISRSHIPITAHAGENGTSGFVESAILDLRARRLGHGLALSDDEKLMHRAREERICIELCPVSNFQTNQFSSAGSSDISRPYPLKKFLGNDNHVCLNTDNPLISYTNMIKECFQASYAYGNSPGLSIWELLRILRTGFIHSFLSLDDRHAMLELADQILFDLFARDDVVMLLHALASRER